MYTLIIPCAGKSSRIKTEYYFDKCLLPVKQAPILFNIIHSWEKHIDQVIVVVNEENHDIIKQYVESFFTSNEEYCSNLHFNFIKQTSGNGSYYAIKDALKISENEKVILNWCDVCLNKEVDELIFSIKKNVVFTTNHINCRWCFNECFIEDNNQSNGVYGIYILNDLTALQNNNTSIGEKDVVTEFDSTTFIPLTYECFYDIGDSLKYTSKIRMLDSIHHVRQFNSVFVGENIVIKKTNSDFIKNNEENWYRNNEFDFLPKIYSYNPLVMEKINGVSVYSFIAKNNEDDILNQVFGILKKIHTSKNTITADYNCCFNEYIKKTLNRLENISFLIKNKDDIFVNGNRLKDPRETILKNKDQIVKGFPKDFFVIHGDPQLSNFLIDSFYKLKIIDPRGYFGNSGIYGDVQYDFAKLFYGFCGGYGKFNSGNNKINIISDNKFEIVPLETNDDYIRKRKKFELKIEDVDYVKISMKNIDLIHALIWLSVTDYVSNDVLSCFFAYIKGALLLEEFLNGK